MDVTDKESILKVKTYIKEKEGKLHILINKFVSRLTLLSIFFFFFFNTASPAQDSSVPHRPSSTIKKHQNIRQPSPLEQHSSIATHSKIGPVTLPSTWHRYFSYQPLSSVFSPKAQKIHKEVIIIGQASSISPA